jgi:hypothetical protein
LENRFSRRRLCLRSVQAQVIAFGNFKRFYIRSVAGSLVLQRYDERYAEYAEVGFSMAWRAQAAMAKSTNNPVPVRLLACRS